MMFKKMINLMNFEKNIKHKDVVLKENHLIL